MSMPGGLTPTRDADSQIQKICNEVKPEVENKVGQNFEEFTAVSYRSQVVNGIMYYIKVNVGDNKCAHIKVWHGGSFELTDVKHPMTPEDKIEPQCPES